MSTAFYEALLDFNERVLEKAFTLAEWTVAQPEFVRLFRSVAFKESFLATSDGYRSRRSASHLTRAG
jgi:hypothetical protein